MGALHLPGAREASPSPRGSDEENEPLAIEPLGHCSGLRKEEAF